MSGDVLTISVEEAARLLGIGRNTAYDLVREGRLPHLRFGRTIRIPLAALSSWLDRQALDGFTPVDRVG